MPYCLSFDGGGSKLNGMLFDDGMNLISACRAGGINTSQGSLDDCRSNIESAVGQLFGAAAPDRIDVMYYTGVGVFPLLVEAVEKRAAVTRTVHLDEAMGGLLAGALKREGVLALSGTGSDIFYIGPERPAADNGFTYPDHHTDGPRRQRMGVGGWGPILGDDGSGVWIGQQAIRAVVRMVNGWGEDTMMLRMIREEWKLANDWDMVHIVHSSPAPLRVCASLTPLVGRAASAGDRVALDIVRQAGHYMAVQTDTLLKKAKLGPEWWDVTLCGGAWKTHPAMLAQFLAELRADRPTLTAERPLFEHVICGPALSLLDRGVPREEAIALLKEKFPTYIVPRPETEV